MLGEKTATVRHPGLKLNIPHPSCFVWAAVLSLISGAHMRSLARFVLVLVLSSNQRTS